MLRLKTLHPPVNPGKEKSKVTTTSVYEQKTSKKDTRGRISTARIPNDRQPATLCIAHVLIS